MWVHCTVVTVLSLGIPGARDENRDPKIDQIIDIGLNQSEVMQHLDVLCNDIGPRLSSSRNLQKACEVTR